MATRMKVILSTMWDLYFYWQFDRKLKMMSGEFYGEIIKHLGFMFNEDETIPDLQKAIDNLFTNTVYIEDYYQCERKINFVEKFSKQLLD